LQFEFYLLLFLLDVILFFAGVFNVPRQDRNTRLILMMIVVALSFMMVMASFQVDMTSCAAALNNTCQKQMNYSYDCVLTKCANWSYDLTNTSQTEICTDAGMTCITNSYQEMALVGFFLLLAAISLLFVITEALGWLPHEEARGGLQGAEGQAPKGFGQA
jgi:hypothetical protein